MSRWKKSTPDRPTRWSDPRWLVQDIEDAQWDEHEAAEATKTTLAPEGTAFELLKVIARECAERGSFRCTQVVEFWGFKTLRVPETVRQATRELEARQFLRVISGERVKGETRQGPNTYILQPWLGSWRRGANRLHIGPKRRALVPPKDMRELSDYDNLDMEQTPVIGARADTKGWRQQTPSIGENIPRVEDTDESPEKKPDTAPLESTNARSDHPASLDQDDGRELSGSDDLGEKATSNPAADDDDWMPNPDNLPPPPAERGSRIEQVRGVTFVDPSRRVQPKTNFERSLLAIAEQIDETDVRDSIEVFDRNQLQTIAYSDVMDAQLWSARESRLRSVVWDDEEGSPYPRRFPIQRAHFRLAERREISLLRVLAKMRDACKFSMVRRKSWARELADMLLYPDPKDKATYGWAAEHVVRRDMLKKFHKQAEDMKTVADTYLVRQGIGLNEWPPYARESHTGRCQPARPTSEDRSTLLGGKACQQSASA